MRLGAVALFIAVAACACEAKSCGCSSNVAAVDAGEDTTPVTSCPPPDALPVAMRPPFEAAALRSLLADARAHSSSAVVVLVNGKVAVQEYFGRDAKGPVTMPVPRGLLGLAVASLVPSVDVPIARYVEHDPRYASFLAHPAKRTITIRQLLDHTSGLGGTNPLSEGQPLDRVLDGALAFGPGAGFTYDESVADAVVDVITAAAHEPAVAYVEHAILAPIGVGCFEHSVTRDGQPAWRMFPTDVARVGQLVLDDGRWQGKEVLRPGDLDTVLQPSPGSRMALLWWFGPPDARWFTLAARGELGQDLVVVRKARIVAVNMPGTRSGLADTDVNPWFERDVLALAGEPPVASNDPYEEPTSRRHDLPEPLPVGDIGASVALGERGWALGGPDAQFYVAYADAETTRDGRATTCVFPLRMASGRGGTWARTVDATALRGRSVVVRGWAKTVTRKHVGLFVNVLAREDSAPLATGAVELPGEADWAPYEVRIVVPGNAVRLQYGVAMEGRSGGLWVEGVGLAVK